MLGTQTNPDESENALAKSTFAQALREAPQDPRASELLEELEMAVGELERVAAA